MLLRLIRKEILEHLMSLRFAIACVLCVLVVVSSVYVRYQDYSQAMDDYNENSIIEKNEINKISEPWRIVWRGIVVRPRPNPLKIFVRGVEDANGLTVGVNSWRPLTLATTEKRDVLAPLFPAMDFNFFVGVIMSLMCIVFAYDAICGERESGTLRLMLSYPVPRDTVLLGKWIGGYVTLIVPFLLAVISAATLVLIQSNISLAKADWFKLSSICLLSLLYIAAIYSAALWVSCLTRRSSTSVIILVTLWMIIVLAIPNLSPYLAQKWRPTRSPVEVEKTRRESVDDIWQRLSEDRMDAYDKEHGFDDPWYKGLNRMIWEQNQRAIRRYIYRAEVEHETCRAVLREHGKIDESISVGLDSQIRLCRWISRISPFATFAIATTELTDTGLVRKRRFLDQLREYQLELCDYGFAAMLEIRKYELEHEGKSMDWKGEREKPIPLFSYVPPATADYLKAIVVDAGLLAGVAMLFFLLCYLAFLRYDVR